MEWTIKGTSVNGKKLFIDQGARLGTVNRDDAVKVGQEFWRMDELSELESLKGCDVEKIEKKEDKLSVQQESSTEKMVESKVSKEDEGRRLRPRNVEGKVENDNRTITQRKVCGRVLVESSSSESDSETETEIEETDEDEVEEEENEDEEHETEDESDTESEEEEEGGEVEVVDEREGESEDERDEKRASETENEIDEVSENEREYDTQNEREEELEPEVPNEIREGESEGEGQVHERTEDLVNAPDLVEEQSQETGEVNSPIEEEAEETDHEDAVTHSLHDTFQKNLSEEKVALSYEDVQVGDVISYKIPETGKTEVAKVLQRGYKASGPNRYKWNVEVRGTAGEMKNVNTRAVQELQKVITTEVKKQNVTTLVVSIPRYLHNEPACVEAKLKEIDNWKEFGVFNPS